MPAASGGQGYQAPGSAAALLRRGRGETVGWLRKAAGNRVGRAGDSPCWAWGSGDERPGICMGARPGLGASGVKRPAHPGVICGVQVGFVVSPLSAPPFLLFPALCRVPWATENQGELPSSSLGLERERLGPDILKRQEGFLEGAAEEREPWGFTGGLVGMGPAASTSDSSRLPRGTSSGWGGPAGVGNTLEAFG